jgi:hypothetical protein
VVVDIINVQGFTVDEPKNYPPISANGHRPKPFELTFERMQPETCQVHIPNISGGIEAGKDIAQFFRVFGNHASRLVTLIETSQPFVPDRPNHITNRNALRNACQQDLRERRAVRLGRVRVPACELRSQMRVEEGRTNLWGGLLVTSPSR